MKDGATLGSASSKLVELPMEDMAKISVGRPEVVDANSFPPTVRYTLKNGRKITVLARGFPLNFDGDVIGVEPQKIQLTMGLLLIGAIQATMTRAAGVHRLDPKKQLEVLRKFDEVGGLAASGPKVATAASLAELKLKEMMLRHGSPADRRHARR
jgi:hypothetical protein